MTGPIRPAIRRRQAVQARPAHTRRETYRCLRNTRRRRSGQYRATTRLTSVVGTGPKLRESAMVTPGLSDVTSIQPASLDVTRLTSLNPGR